MKKSCLFFVAILLSSCASIENSMKSSQSQSNQESSQTQTSDRPALMMNMIVDFPWITFYVPPLLAISITMSWSPLIMMERNLMLFSSLFLVTKVFIDLESGQI